MEGISQRLKQLRKSKGWTQKNVADQLNIERVNYCRYENGTVKLSIELVIVLAEIFGETTDYILTGKEK